MIYEFAFTKSHYIDHRDAIARSYGDVRSGQDA